MAPADSITMGLVPSHGTIGHCWAYNHAIDHPGLGEGEPPGGGKTINICAPHSYRHSYVVTSPRGTATS